MKEYEQQYLSIKEFAHLAGISTQTVYKQINGGRLAKYTVKVDGRLTIASTALELYTDKGSENDTGGVSDGQVDNELINRINQLKEEITFLRGQIQTKDEQIAGLSESLITAQKLHMADRQRLLQLEQKTTEQEPEENQPEVNHFQPEVDKVDNKVDNELTPEPKNSGILGFFKRLFG